MRANRAFFASFEFPFATDFNFETGMSSPFFACNAFRSEPGLRIAFLIQFIFDNVTPI